MSLRVTVAEPSVGGVSPQMCRPSEFSSAIVVDRRDATVTACSISTSIGATMATDSAVEGRQTDAKA